MFTPKTKALIFNNPNNPLGSVSSADEISSICNLCCKHDVLMISDDVYEHMVYDNHEMVRVATLPGMWDRTISIGFSGKTISVTGWKLGWAYGPDHLIRNCGVFHQNCVYACPTPIQEAVARGFEKEPGRLGDKESYYKSISVNLKGKEGFLSWGVDRCGDEASHSRGRIFHDGGLEQPG